MWLEHSMQSCKWASMYTTTIKKKEEERNNQGMGNREYEAVWTVTSPMNECMGILLKKMSLPTHQ